MQQQMINRLSFTVPPKIAQKIFDWQLKTTKYIAETWIESKGGVRLITNDPESNLRLTTKLPTDSPFQLYVGDVSGFYSYIFRPDANKTTLSVGCEIFPRFLAPAIVKPFETAEIELLRLSYGKRGERYFSTHPYTSSRMGATYIDYIQPNGMSFYIDNQSLDRLESLGWNMENRYEYHYKFVPTSIDFIIKAKLVSADDWFYVDVDDNP